MTIVAKQKGHKTVTRETESCNDTGTDEGERRRTIQKTRSFIDKN